MKLKSLLIAGIAAIALAFTAQAQTVSQLAYFNNNPFPYPESIAIDDVGNLYTPLTFGGAVNKVSPDGTVTQFATIPDFYLLGAAFDAQGNLTVVAGGSGIWKVSPTGVATKFSDIPGLVTINDLVYDKDGNLYVGDDTLELIWKIDASGNATVWSTDPLFNVVTQVFPFEEGVNGLAISQNGKSIYVTNTSEGRIIEIPILEDGSAGVGEILIENPDLIGIDGLKVLPNGDIYTAQNLKNRILKIGKNGRQVSVVAEGGILKFPTGLVLSQDKQTIYVANNGDAFFGTNPENQGVVKIELK